MYCTEWEEVDDLVQVHWCGYSSVVTRFGSGSSGLRNGTMVPIVMQLVGNKSATLTDGGIAAEFEQALEQRQQAKETIKQQEALVEECDKKLQAVMDGGQFTRVTAKGWTVSQREAGERRTIDPSKLLSLGVPAHVIEAATKITMTKPGITVRKAAERDEFLEYAEEIIQKAEHDNKA